MNSTIKQTISPHFFIFALIASEEAVNHACIDFTSSLAVRSCVVFGSNIGDQETIEQVYLQYYTQDNKRPHPYPVPKLLLSATSSQISMK